MAKDYARDHRGENVPVSSKSRRRRSRKVASVKVKGVSAFERETGWTPGAAVDMACEARLEERLFGRTQLYV